MTGAEVGAFAKSLGLKYAVLLDGGHVAAMNGDKAFAKLNTALVQSLIIQAI
jgi:hypothetical protein